jgi:hypothetical protein
MAAANPNPGQVPITLVGSFPEDIEIILNLCKSMKSIADAAFVKRKESYFEGFYAIENLLFDRWINIVGEALLPLLAGPTQSESARKEHDTIATALRAIRKKTKSHRENFDRQKQGVALIPPNYDFFGELRELSEMLSYFCAAYF